MCRDAGLGAERVRLDQPERDDQVDQRHEQDEADEDELERRGPALGTSSSVEGFDGSMRAHLQPAVSPSSPTSGSVAVHGHLDDRLAAARALLPGISCAVTLAYSSPTVRAMIARVRAAPSSSEVSASAAWYAPSTAASCTTLRT